jgi:hypothetical protein
VACCSICAHRSTRVQTRARLAQRLRARSSRSCRGHVLHASIKFRIHFYSDHRAVCKRYSGKIRFAALFLAIMATPSTGSFIAVTVIHGLVTAVIHGLVTVKYTRSRNGIRFVVTSYEYILLSTKPWRPRSFEAARHQPRPSTHA